MHRPWSPIEIEQKMREVVERQDDAVAEMLTLGNTFASARRDYEVCKNQALLKAKADKTLGTDAQRLAWATIQAADLRAEKDRAESAFITQRAVVATLQSQADTLRSLARSSRDLLDQPGFGG